MVAAIGIILHFPESRKRRGDDTCSGTADADLGCQSITTILTMMTTNIAMAIFYLHEVMRDDSSAEPDKVSMASEFEDSDDTLPF